MENIRKEIILWQITNGTYGRGIISAFSDKNQMKNPIPENLKPLDDGFKHAETLRRYLHVDTGGDYKDPSCLDEYNIIIQEDGTIRVIPKWNRPDSERLFAIGFLSDHYTLCRDYLGVRGRN